MSFALTMLIALIIEAVFGWPRQLFDRIGHPVTWIGAAISRLEAEFNHRESANAELFWKGGVTALLIAGGCWSIGWGLMGLLPDNLIGTLIGGVLAAPLIATRSLYDHVEAVAVPLEADDIPEARAQVARIVGRNPEMLDEPGIARASVESLAENTSDGVIAPLFWGLLLGLPGLLAYKAINTLDSMIGYRTERYEHFGKIAARLDDLVNFIPARLTGLGFAALSGQPTASMQTMWRDAGLHRSPNAGWPEAAMAAALDCRLSGPRAYDSGVEDHPWVNGDAPDPTGATVFEGLKLYRNLMLATALTLLLIGLL